MTLAASIAAYDAFLRDELGGEVIAEALARKRRKMAEHPFAFLRGSYFRWAETIAALAPALMDAPSVLAVGDIHLENFGTWRDADGRLVWGVNDLDEAAAMPFTLDLLRLAASALLAADAAGTDTTAAAIAEPLLDGYRAGLATPRPFVLEREHPWLRQAVMVPDEERRRFWATLAKRRERFEALPASGRPALAQRYRDAAVAALPPGAATPALWYREAGLGSLGRPRWVAEALWQGEVVLREAKALLPSAWTRVAGRGAGAMRVAELAAGRFRSPDPWFSVSNGVAVRRLSPNSRKINAASADDEDGGIGIVTLLGRAMLEAMGAELAALHLGSTDAAPITADLARRGSGWLAEATTRAAAHVVGDFRSLR